MLVVGPNETFISYIEQVLPALGEGSVEQRPIGSLVSEPHGEIDETRELATLKGSARIAVVMHRLLWGRLTFEDIEIPVSRRRDRHRHRRTSSETGRAVRERTFSYEAGRERFRERLAGMLASRLLDAGLARQPGGRDQRSSARPRSTAARSTKAWPKETPEGLVGKLFTNRARLEEVAGDLLEPEEIALLLKAEAATKRPT